MESLVIEVEFWLRLYKHGRKERTVIFYSLGQKKWIKDVVLKKMAKQALSLNNLEKSSKKLCTKILVKYRVFINAWDISEYS